jgi:hypothetical protein
MDAFPGDFLLDVAHDMHFKSLNAWTHIEAASTMKVTDIGVNLMWCYIKISLSTRYQYALNISR